MSYLDIKPSFYEMFQPGDAWHAGGEGWTRAPFPGWGENPNLVGPATLGRSPDGIGAYYATQYNKPILRQFNGLGGVEPAQVLTAVAAMGAMLFAGAWITGRVRGASLRANPRRRRRRR